MAEGKPGTAAPTEFAPLASDEASAEVEMQSKRDRRSCCRCAAGAALVPLICGAVLLVGRAVELHAVAHARSTDGLYSSSWVCVRDEAGREQSVSNHSLLATSGGTLSVVHCAKCGACSSETDELDSILVVVSAPQCTDHTCRASCSLIVRCMSYKCVSEFVERVP